MMTTTFNRKMRAVRLSSVTDEVLSAVLLHPALKELTVDKNLALASAGELRGNRGSISNQINVQHDGLYPFTLFQDPCLLGQVVARMETVNLAKVPDNRLRCLHLHLYPPFNLHLHRHCHCSCTVTTTVTVIFSFIFIFTITLTFTCCSP